MPVFKGGAYREYNEFCMALEQRFQQRKEAGDTQTPYGTAWFELMDECCPSISRRIKGTLADPSGLDEIPKYIHRNANRYFSMFYGEGWYEQPDVNPGSGYETFIHKLRGDQ